MNSQNVSFISNYEFEEEEDYIEMELSSFDIEFEFQMSISSANFPADDLFQDDKLLPLHHLPRRPTTTAAATTLSESCCNDDYLEWCKELNAFIHSSNPTKTTWIKKIKDSIFGIKIRAFSKAYIRTLFHNSSRNFQNVQGKIGKEEGGERRSFSSVIKGLSSSSSSSSSNSSSFSVNYNGDSLRRSNSATEIEGSIAAAIAHCKKSQHILNSTPDSI